ncbi:MAG: hypothetical protein AAB372_04280 [Patescibacteria group bacterium]
MRVVRDAVQVTLKETQFKILLITFWVLFFVLMFFLPVDLVPGNDVQFQASLLSLADYLTMILIAGVAALSVAVQMKIFVLKIGSYRTRAKDVALGGAGVMAGVISSLFASATCALCVGALFSFLGFGVAVFLVQYRWYIVTGALFMLLSSLYLASRRLMKGCEECSLSL